MQIRLDKFISDLGLASRREVRTLVKMGRLLVNDAHQSPEQKVDTERDEVTLDGESLCYSPFRYLMMHKPQGYICATEDKREQTVLALLDDRARRQELFTVGRLDKDTEGLLLLTNDGDYAHRVISPKSGVIKTYYARVEGVLTEADRAAAAAGIVLGDGTQCLPARLEILDPGACRLYISEGKYHQVKRMLASLGKPVTYLRREAIGDLKLDPALALGQWRDLTPEELEQSLQAGL